MSDLDPKIFKFTFTDIVRNIFPSKKSSYEKINNKNKNDINNKNDKNDINNKVNYGSIS